MPTVAELFDFAVRSHQSGNIAQAGQLYQDILQVEPNHSGALHLYGVLLNQVGRHDAAIDCIVRAIKLEPDNGIAHFNLGAIYQTLGKFAEAAACFEQAVRLQPQRAEAHNNLGNALNKLERLAEAAECYRQAIRLQPQRAEFHSNLGSVLRELGQLNQAEASLRQALSLKPELADCHYNLGLILRDQGKQAEAVVCLQRAIQLKPDFVSACNSLGNLLFSSGRLDEAAQMLRQSLSLNPDQPAILSNLGSVLAMQGMFIDAIAYCRRALQLKPDQPDAHGTLGNAYLACGDLDQAVTHYRQAIELDPRSPRGHTNLGNAFMARGDLEEALECYRGAMQIAPENATAHSNYLLCLNYVPDMNPATVFEEHLRWASIHAEPLAASIRQRTVDRDPNRRLRIGYVSPDFRDHPVALFIEPVLTAHDRERVQVYCYSDVRKQDEVTQRLRSSADVWRPLGGLSDEQAADLIRQDGIDILIDLAGHTANNRMLLFARKPATVQVTHFGYPNTTGLPTMDYRITDCYADPPGMTESFHVEKLIRLPDVAWCYQPAPEPVVESLPALRSNSVTFGSFNNVAKITPRVVELWSRILEVLSDARLVMLTGVGQHGENRLHELFEQTGIPRQRVSLLSRKPRAQYLHYHNTVDICFDPFPYNGGVTTCDALWMGVPVITLAGNSYVSRQGVSLLTNVGLPEWIAQTPDTYVEIAKQWAGDLSRLAELRMRLRELMRQSPLTDAVRFTRNLEEAYRRMWQQAH